MWHPFQRLQACRVPESSVGWVLVGAVGSQISCLRGCDGTLLSTWSPESTGPSGFNSGQSVKASDSNHATLPRGKRRKLSPAAETSSNCSPGNEVPASSVIILTVSWNQKHVVAVTGEDKCVRVFSLDDGGQLKLLSERSMPKRPSAIAITSDDTTILCADKFGDVYSLPLHASSETVATSPKEADVGTPGSTISASTKKYVPAANSRTVHTARNQRALQNQLRLTNQVSEKTAPSFDHRLLLGHVSMLTDILYIELDTSLSPHGKACSHIITADRDEHIRVSRGPPQAYIIECFCLGHRGFITKLCSPDWRPQILISGDGDGILIVWNWAKGDALQVLDLKPFVHQYLESRAKASGNSFNEQAEAARLESMAERESAELGIDDDGSRDADDALTSDKIAISGIWTMSQRKSIDAEHDINMNRRAENVLVAYEGVSALFICELSPHSELIYRQQVPLSGNVLDVAVSGPTSVVVSVDTIHQCDSTTVIRKSVHDDEIGLQSLSAAEDGTWSVDSVGKPFNALKAQGSFEINVEQDSGQAKSLRDLLYRFQNLRKQGFED